MARVFTYRKYGVYVFREVGERHHLPHAHVKDRRRRVASVFLYTLEFYDVAEQPPAALVELIAERQEELLAEWEDLNDA